MSKPVKIFELKGKDWYSGISIQSDFALGGLFQSGTTNPFKRMGYLSAVPTVTEIDDTTITSSVTHLASANSGSEGYVFAINNSAVDKTKSFYRIKVSDGTVIDYSDKIDQNTSSAINHKGVFYHRGRVIYEQDGSMRSNTLTPTTGNDTNILTSSLTAGTDTPTMFSVGPDGVLYFTANQGASIGRIVSVSATTSNTASAFSFTDTSLVPKDLCNDGQYLVAIADNNSSRSSYGNSSCRVFFWDTIKTKADIIYDIPDSYLISCRYVKGAVLILGSSGIWVCNSATAPRLLFPLTSSKLPTSARQVTTRADIMYWVAPGAVNRIYAFGSKIGNQIFFNPFTLSSGNSASALVSSGDYFIGSSPDGVFLHNTNGTGVNASSISVPRILDKTYSFSYAKVVLKSPISSGQVVTLSIFNGNGQVIMDATDKNNTTDPSKQTLIFGSKHIAGSMKQFEDIYLSITTQTDVAVQRVTVYGIPLEDDNSQII